MLFISFLLIPVTMSRLKLVATCLLVVLLAGVLLTLVVLSVGEAVEELPVPELLLTLSGDCGLTGEGDCLDLLDDLLRVLALGIVFLASVSISILTNSFRSSFSILSSVVFVSLSQSLPRLPCSRFS